MLVACVIPTRSLLLTPRIVIIGNITLNPTNQIIFHGSSLRNHPKRWITAPQFINKFVRLAAHASACATISGALPNSVVLLTARGRLLLLELMWAFHPPLDR